MRPASELRTGIAFRFGGELFKVIEASYHAGQGKMGGVTHAKVRSLASGHVKELKFHTDEKVEEVHLDRVPVEFLYADGGMCFFMNTETFDQVALETERLGRAAGYLKEGMSIPMEFLDGTPVGIVFPDVVEVTIAETAPPAHAQGNESVKKEAKLENGLRLLVPQFVGPGDVVRVQVESGAYVDRVRIEKKR